MVRLAAAAIPSAQSHHAPGCSARGSARHQASPSSDRRRRRATRTPAIASAAATTSPTIGAGGRAPPEPPPSDGPDAGGRLLRAGPRRPAIRRRRRGSGGRVVRALVVDGRRSTSAPVVAAVPSVVVGRAGRSTGVTAGTPARRAASWWSAGGWSWSRSGSGGSTAGSASSPKAQPSTLPGGGTRLPAPEVLYVHDPPRGACQYAQYALAGGAAWHGSEAGSPSMRQSRPGNWVVPLKVKPARVSASKPERTGCGAHRTCTPSPKADASTTTVMPVPSVQAPELPTGAPAEAALDRARPADPARRAHPGGRERRAGSGRPSVHLEREAAAARVRHQRTSERRSGRPPRR